MGIDKNLLTMNPMEKITKMNTTSENMAYLVDKKRICVNIKNCTDSHLEKENGYQEQFIVILKKSFSMINRNTSLQSVETIFKSEMD